MIQSLESLRILTHYYIRNSEKYLSSHFEFTERQLFNKKLQKLEE